MELEDQEARRRFQEEIDHNFLVIAPAGVGKTTALTGRILQIAAQPDAQKRLESLVVVTYTRKAAREIQDRVFGAISRLNQPTVLAASQRIFFGTIDSLFSNLLREFGHHLGLGENMQIIEQEGDEETELWRDFLEIEHPTSLPPEANRHLFQLYDWEKLAEIGRKNPLFRQKNQTIPPLPEISWNRILATKTAMTKPDCLSYLEEWRANHSQNLHAPLPEALTVGGKEFLETCRCDWLRPLLEWVETVGGIFCQNIARDYHRFKLAAGKVTFDDIKVCMDELLSLPEIATELHQRRLSILLDEAQDTDIQAFQQLLRLPPQENGKILGGHFCLVGDPQQSIYLGDQQSFKAFQQGCENLISSGQLEKLIFFVTMRCPKKVLDYVNSLYPRVLDGRPGQASFVPMRAFPGKLPGSVAKIRLPPIETGQSKDETIRQEADALATFFTGKSPTDFGLTHWRQLAILGARKKWLQVLHKSFQAKGLRSQLQLRNRTFGDSPLFACLCGLCRALTCPTDEVEIAFLLREIFPLSDRSAALYAARTTNPLKFALLHERQQTSEVETFLNQLFHLSKKTKLLPPRAALLEIEHELDFSSRIDCTESAVKDDWEMIFEFAAVCESRGLTFRDFSRELAKKFWEKRAPQAIFEDHIQLDTLHGSKGLEWDVVLLPFLSTPIASNNQDRICPFLAKFGSETRLCCSKEGKNFEQFKAENEEAAILLNQRLFYVGMTRPRHLLLLTERIQEKTSKNAPISFLQMDLEKLESFRNIIPAPSPTQQREANFPRQIFSNAKDRTLEESFTILRTSRQQKIASIQSETLDYGNWYHKTIQFFPWKLPAEAQKKYLMDALIAAPQAERGQYELERFHQSGLFDKWVSESVAIHSEWPFYTQTVDGTRNLRVIDCIFISKKDIVIIDWKTDITNGSHAMEFIQKYRGQINEYKDFAGSYFRKPTYAFLYLTFLGKLFPT